MIHRNFELALGSLVHDEVPIHVFLFYKKRDVSCKGSGQIPSVDDIVRGQIHQKIFRSQAFDRDSLEVPLNRPPPNDSSIVQVPEARNDI